MNTFYDRTSNILLATGDVITGLIYNPVYGSRVSFTSRTNQYETQNGYYNLIPMSINNVDAKFELRFDLDQSGAQKLTNFIENKKGSILFPFTDASSFYKTVSGVCDNYAINHINNYHYEVATSFEVNQAPMLLNWSGMSFVNKVAQPWSGAKTYAKYETIYSGVSQNKLDNFYYCATGHTSSSSSIDGPTGSSTKWTQAFFFEPDIGLQNDVQIKIIKTEFKNSFVQRGVTRKNLAPVNLTLKFTNLPTIEAKSIMHFLENKAGYRRFLYNPPSVYNKPKVYYCPSWSHTLKFYDSHDIDVTLIEDPLGIIPTGS